ncbi:MAG: hypothetical protein ACPL4K_06385, partial [Candidatus Margulisiibacteriota bacterium]
MWADEQLKKLKRRRLPITFDPHLFVRKAERGFEIDKVVETIKTGKVILKKSVEPRKVCFARYFGKENKTYTVIALFHDNYAEVKTCWVK